jgi:hypothetical protein
VDVIHWLSGANKAIMPEERVDELIRLPRGYNSLPLKVVMERVEKWPMFSTWAAFKAADMIERLTETEVNFPIDVLTFYKEPRAGLEMIEGDVEENIQTLLDHFGRFTAPPSRGRNSRQCGIAEIETVLCKNRGHSHGTYWPGKDIREIRHGLKGWGATAARLLAGCPAEVKRARDGQGLLF